MLLFSAGGIPHVPSKSPDDEYWLERAREAYALSDRMVYPEAKRVMLEIEAGYQRLAQTAKERTGRKPRSSRATVGACSSILFHRPPVGRHQSRQR